jgi:hypothetical protein
MAEEETHEAPKEEEVKETVTPPPPPPQHDDDLRSAVHALTETVTGLVQVVEQMKERASDESPVNKPWTHRNFG